MPSWLTKTTVPPLFTGEMTSDYDIYNRLLWMLEQLGLYYCTLLMTMEIHNLLQTNCHCIIPVHTEGKMSQYTRIFNKIISMKES